MKFCMDTNCKRKGIELEIDKFPRNRAMKDERNMYCRVCSLRRTHEYRGRLRSKRAAQKKLVPVERKQMVKAKPTPVEIVKGAN